MNRDETIDILVCEIREEMGNWYTGGQESIRAALEAAIPAPVEDAELAFIRRALTECSNTRVDPGVILRLIAEVERLRARPDVVWREATPEALAAIADGSYVLVIVDGLHFYTYKYEGKFSVGGSQFSVNQIARFAVVAPGKDGE